MLEIDNQATADGYTDACTLGPVSEALAISYVIANAAVRAQLAPLLASGSLGEWGPELLLTPQTNTVQRVGGIRFRSAVAGSPARVVAQLFQPADPVLGAGTVFSGTLAASGGVTPVSGGALELIQDQLLLGPAATIPFANIPQTFLQLLLILTLRDTNAAALVNGLLQFNGDTGANYDDQENTGAGAVAFAGESFGQVGHGIQYPGAGALASLFSAHTLEIPNYTSALMNKVVIEHARTKVGIAANNMRARETSGFWRNSAPVTSILLSAVTAFAAGSRATLYGIGS